MTGRVKPLGSRRAHFWLLQGMLRRTGADAQSAMDRGDLSSEEWASLVETCRGCDAPCACRRFLDDPAAARTAPPAYCRNAQALADMPQCAEEESV